MKPKQLIFPIIIIVLALWIVSNKPTDSQVKSAETQPAVPLASQKSETNLSTQTKTFGVVEVEVAPEQMSAGSPIIFKLALNNHSIDLDFDLTQISELKDDRGNGYLAQKWTGNTGSHHLQGDLIFDTLKPGTQNITLIIKDIDQTTNTFTWNLNTQ